MSQRQKQFLSKLINYIHRYVQTDDYLLPKRTTPTEKSSYSMYLLTAKIERSLKNGRYSERNGKEFNYVRWLIQQREYPFDKWNTRKKEIGIDLDAIQDELLKLTKKYNFKPETLKSPFPTDDE